MPNDLIHDGMLVLEGTLIPDDYAIYYEDGGAFSASQVRAALSRLSGDIVVRVNSPGGDPRGGEAIRVMLSEHAGGVTVQVVGEACSAASLMIMGADRIEMSAGSVMMIHDPSTITFGTADDHDRAAAMLNEIADTYAAVYAARAGRSTAEMRQIMRDELWMGPDRAIAEGFADALMQSDAPPQDAAPGAAMIDAARASYRAAMTALGAVGAKVHKAPSGVPQQTAVGGHQMAVMAATQEAQMPEETVAAQGGQAQVDASAVNAAAASPAPVTMSAEAAASAERARIRAIQMSARPHVASGAIEQSLVDELIDSPNVTPEMASHRILQSLVVAPGQQDVRMASGPRSRILRDDRETRVEGMVAAMTARLTGDDPNDDRADAYRGMTIHEMAAVSMGRERPGMGGYADREAIIMSAMHSTSDFPNILSTSVNRVLAAQYDLVEQTFASVSRQMDFNDFRPHDVVRPDEFPTLTKVNETGEIKFGALGDSKETVALGAYATGIAVSRQALVNDDLGAIQGVIDNAAMIVPEFEEATFWAYFLSNAALADGTAMFHADHGNLAASGGAISVTTVAAGRQALRSMKAADGKRVIMSNGPSILLVGPAQETAAEQFIAQNVQPTKSADVNPFAGKLRVVTTEQITDASWYLLVDPAKRSCNFRHGYLTGRTAPRVRVDEPFGVQGMRMTLEHDFGVGGVNYRGGYKNAGA